MIDTVTTQATVEELLDTTAAAELVKLSIATIYALTSRRQIPHYKRGGKLYFRRSELIEWLTEGRREVITSSTAERHLASIGKVGRP